MNDWQQRVIDEKAALDEKASKLFAFFATDAFHALPFAEHRDLALQWEYMSLYSDTLKRRIARFV